jgi:hypothetical protein
LLPEELVTRIVCGLETMPPMPASRHELQLLIAQIEAKIRAAQERGCTYVEIAKQISESGYPIKSSTLRTAIQRHRQKAGIRRPRRRKAGSVAPARSTGAASPPASSARRT